MNNSSDRIVFLDWLRVIACFAVILVHAIEPFYLGGPIASKSDALWVTLLDSALRSSVPLFIMASSYLLFPLKTDTSTFYRKRFTRVLIPYFAWVVLYAFLPPLFSGHPTDFAAYFKGVIFNFPMQYGHLWFVMMLIGIYFLMPLLSPWAEKVSKKEETGYLLLWTFTTIMPFIRQLEAAWTRGTHLWGECPWNEFGAFHSISGFIGYLILGHYFRKFVGDVSWKKTLAYAIPFWLVGYAISAGGFWAILPIEEGFPALAFKAKLPLELTWDFCTFGVLLQTVAYFMLIRKIASSGWFYRHIILPVSKLSYGIYLMHMLLLTPVFGWVRSWGLATPLTMILTASITFVSCTVICRLISYIPKSKYIIG